MGASSNFEWYVDESSGSGIRGWIVDLVTRFPTEVSFFSEGKRVFQATAGGSRSDVQLAGRGAQYCGINVAFDPRIWKVIKTIDVVLPDGSIFTSVTKPESIESSTSTILENYITATRRLRAKAYPSVAAPSASVVRRSFCPTSIDGNWLETLLLPEAELPCFIVINDEFVTVISSDERRVPADHEERQERRLASSLDQLTHIQLTADAHVSGQNYAAFSGDLFNLPRDITVFYEMRVVKG